MSEQTQQPSPELFFQTVNSYQRTAAVKAAVELDVFSAIGEGGATAQEVAASRGASERGVRILCDYLVIAGLLTKDGGRYRLTRDSAVFLDRRSPAYMGGALEFLLSPMIVSNFDDLASAVRRGGTTSDDGGTVAPENPVWVKFARAMAPMMAMNAQAMAAMSGDLAGREPKVLDIAAGHGLFGIAFARQFPGAEVYALDWPAVLEVAKENASAAGVSGRYHTIGGSAFEADFGEGYDVVLLTNFLHHFDPPTCESLLRKVRAALKEGGRVLTLEFVPDEDRVSPPVTAAFSLMMLAGTQGGDAYTFPELERMFSNAGFASSELRELPASPQKLVVSLK
ncbi:MAG TPA: class I SAM-dependent methyltransferase [Pyrinomonadaceae bacterium]|jgi:2-polyprenyl-3-methyl-5-hydroxy-6-metoxy-1,4-benzoquinol methylase|nr:class I SAM-dependent methyltransferase [Pyrinomonadaceae bacterium]